MSLPTSNKRDIDVSVELDNYELEPCNNIDVLLIPTGVTAFVSFKRDAPTTHMYPLYTNATCELKNKNGFADAEVIYLHTIGTSATELQLNLSVIVPKQNSFIINKNADKLDITDSIMERFDKIQNPYETAVFSNVEATNTSLTTLLNKTLACDKIVVYTTEGYKGSTGACELNIKIDGKRVLGGRSYTYFSPTFCRNITLEGIKGKTIEIEGYNDAGNEHGYSLQEFTLKT